MSRTFRFVTSCLNSVYGTFAGAFADGKKYRMSRKFAARIARNVSHARRGGMAGLGGVPAFGVPGVGEPDGGVGWPPRRWGGMVVVGMPNGPGDAYAARGGGPTEGPAPAAKQSCRNVRGRIRAYGVRVPAAGRSVS